MQALTVLQFDLRTAPFCPDSAADRYRACLDMTRWADQSGLSVVGFSEHHNTEDGFLSSPLMMAMATAGMTERIGISVSALQLPLHDPVRVAEDITALDLISGGRFTTTLGLGYRELEYNSFGVDWKARGKVFDEKIGVLMQALSGGSFSYRDSPFVLSPTPQSNARSLLLIGGNSHAAARRAARFKLFFAPAIDDPELERIYQEECEKNNFKHGFVVFPREPCLTLIAEDPGQAWAELGPYLLYDATAYANWKHPSRRAYAESSATSLDDLRAEGKYAILSPEQAVEKINRKGSINLAPLCGGVPVEAGWRSLQLFADQVIPHIN